MTNVPEKAKRAAWNYERGEKVAVTLSYLAASVK